MKRHAVEMSEPPFGPRHCMGCRYGYTDTGIQNQNNYRLQSCVHLQIFVLERCVYALYLSGCVLCCFLLVISTQEHNNATGDS